MSDNSILENSGTLGKIPSEKQNVTLKIYSQSFHHSNAKVTDRFFFFFNHATTQEMLFSSIGFESVSSFGHLGRDNLAVSCCY